MATLFDERTADQMINRINQLTPGSKPLWGKMTVSQMLAHCCQPLIHYLEGKKMKQSMMGFFFGRMAKKKLFGDKPWPQGLPTAPEFKIANDKDFLRERETLIRLVKKFETEGPNIVSGPHPFFGKLTLDEWGIMGYRHLDHHLRQFGV